MGLWGRKLSKGQRQKLVEELDRINKAVRATLPRESQALFDFYSKRVRFVPLSREKRLYKAGNNVWERKAENTTSGFVVGGRFVPTRIYISMPEEEYMKLLDERKKAEPTFKIAHELAHNITRAFAQEAVEASKLYMNEAALRERMVEFYATRMSQERAREKAAEAVRKHPKVCAAYVAHTDNEGFADGTATVVSRALLGKEKMTPSKISRFMQNRPYPVRVAFNRMLGGRVGPRKKGWAEAIDEFSRGTVEGIGGRAYRTLGGRTRERMLLEKRMRRRAV